MKKSLIWFAVCLFVVSATNRGMADTFSFSYNATEYGGSEHFQGSGTFTATLNSPGAYTITGISGSASYFGTLYTITGLLPAGTFGSDNAFFYPPSPYYFTLAGASFGLSNGAVEEFYSGALGPPDATVLGFGIIEASGDSTADILNDGALVQSQFTVTDLTATPAPIPEPSSLALLGSGVAGAICMLRRRQLS